MAFAPDHHEMFRLILAFQKITDPDLRRMVLQHVEEMERQQTTGREERQSAEDLRMLPKRFADDAAAKNGIARPEPDAAVVEVGLQTLAGPISG
ncbi:hypothetical protein [Bradyrhizobium stylosanthis]|jgi:hypothetical protein|uniref:Uncharacterized protein n=1 Tax=Bradyrhizobium stylosanthis TaxID=1803665 RepID=A0A560DIK7_9BRAD|nr:hypothetical protein [Bradyrhizobium stylosanthis]TWA96951.1 hypothetical protein FBZ96_1062 [Bradyrhizobium stylosanthis]